MTIQDNLKELKQRREKALLMGGKERIEKQHGKGKKTVRERINLLVDEDSFQEYGQLVSHVGEHGVSQSVEEITPADGVVYGIAKVNERTTCIVGEDFTVKGGTFGINHGAKKGEQLSLPLRRGSLLSGY